MFNKAFTLVELIIVIIIVAILAVIAIPKFMDFSYQATVRAEQRVMLEMFAAIQADHAKTYAETGVDQWYQGNPLDLLAHKPEGWRWYGGWYANDVTYIFCPHCTSISPDYQGPGVVFGYRRSYSDPTYPGYPSSQCQPKAGNVWVHGDKHDNAWHSGGIFITDWNP